MPSEFEPGCLPTAIGSMPHTNPEEACSLILKYIKDIPCWPQLSRRSFLENMYAQYSEGFPGLVIDEEKERVWIDNSQSLDKPLEQLYTRYLEDRFDDYVISAKHAAGFYELLSRRIRPRAIKGQITGPVTLGLGFQDKDQRAIIYDDVLSDALARHLRLKASWQEMKLRSISPHTIIFLDEPYMVSFGSAYFNVAKEKVINLINEVFGGITGLKGIHCCGNTDWSVILATKLNILSFDTYNYAESLTLYPDEIKSFLRDGGIIAWGIVPNKEKDILKESVSSLQDRLGEAVAPFTRNGQSYRQILKQSLITPSCGLDGLSPEAAAQVLELLAKFSQQIRKRYIT